MRTTALRTLCAAALTLAVSTSIYAAMINGQGTWESTLQGRDLDGNPSTAEAYYDTDLNITWLADANAAVGSAYDTINPGTGQMAWTTANTWAANLNINGVTGWSLPTINDPSAICFCGAYSGGGNFGYNNPSTSEMAHLFYTTLGNTGAVDTSGNLQAVYGMTNAGPFSNVQSDIYWSATEYAPGSSNAWFFGTSNGLQGNVDKSAGFYAWAVHAGDAGASVVPVPAAVWLFGSGFLGLISVARRKAA